MPPVARSEDSILKEYQLNVDLWKHDDVMRQARNQTLLGMNSAALVVVGLIFTATKEPAIRSWTAVIAGVVGFQLCSVWVVVQARHLQYLEFYGTKLRSLETKLPYSTFYEMERAFNEKAQVYLAPGRKVFKVKKPGDRSSSAAEAGLPRLLRLLWAVTAVIGATTLIA